MTTGQAAGEQPAWMMLDQQLALKTAATRLAEEFKGVYGPETIGRLLESSFDQFADPAGQTLADVRPIRDDLERRVLNLLAELDIPHATHEKDA